MAVTIKKNIRGTEKMTTMKVKFSFFTLTILGLNLLITPLILGQANGEHILKDFNGNVKIQKKGSSGFQNVTPYEIGSVLKYGDTFRLSRKATVTIICSNQDEKRLPQGKTTILSYKICDPGIKTKHHFDGVLTPAPAPVPGLW